MQPATRWLVPLLLPLTCAAGPGDPQPSTATETPRGYMVSDHLVEVLMKRWAFDLSDDLDLTEQEETEVFQALRRRWTPFVNANQERLAPLVERYMGAMIDPEPPEPEEVRAWATEALKVQDLILEQLNRTEEEVAELLPLEKRGQLRGEFVQYRMGMGYMNGQFKKWQSGDFDPNFWDRQSQRRAQRRDRRRQKMLDTQKAEMNQLASLSEWDLYVQDFVARFELDPAQKTSANSVLADVKQRAKSYLDSRRDDIDQARTALETAEAQERSSALDRQRELFEPLQALFAELQTRLDKIPTEAQRGRVDDGLETHDSPSGQS